MPVTISDQLLEDAGLSEREARLEIACRLYDAGKLTMPQATRWAGVSRTELEAALLQRHLPLVRVDEPYWQQEVEGLKRLGPAQLLSLSATPPPFGRSPNSVIWPGWRPFSAAWWSHRPWWRSCGPRPRASAPSRSPPGPFSRCKPRPTGSFSENFAAFWMPERPRRSPWPRNCTPMSC